jgi:uncharacterized protein (TIGR02147 family)
MKRLNATETLKGQLESELKRRQRINSAYSLRAFARDLGMTAGYLSLVLAGKRQFSLERITQVMQKLGYSATQVSQFLGAMHPAAVGSPKRGPRVRKLPRRPLSADDVVDPDENVVTLQLDAFQTVSDWYHAAILELTRCADFHGSPEWIAGRLRITVSEAAQACERLLRLGLLARGADGRLAKTDNFLSIPSGTPSRALRSYHAQFLEKAKAALDAQNVDERDITNLVVAVDPQQLPALKEEIKQFRRRIGQLLDGPLGKDPKEVYQLGIQLFRLSESIGANNERKIEV